MGAILTQPVSGLLAAFFVDLAAAALVVDPPIWPPDVPAVPPVALELGAMLLGAWAAADLN